MKDKESIKLLGGILICYIVAKVFKKVIKQSRPIKGITYGMPSSRSTVMTFIIVFLLMNYKFSQKTKVILIVVGLLSLCMKYYLKEHSLNQLLVGFILGLIIAYIVNKINI